MNQDQLQKLETIAKIVSLVAVPILVAIFGWIIQAELSEKGLRKEYVQLSLSILSNQSKVPENNSLREWAIQLLAENAPVRLSESAIHELQTGTSLNPKVVNIPISVPCGPLEIKTPQFPFNDAKQADNIYTKTTLLLADRHVRMGYIAELEAVLSACRGSLNLRSNP